jgi:L-lactate utilization protein LutB
MQQMLRDIEVTLQSLKKNRFDALYAQTKEDAKKIMLEIIPLTASVGVGVGDSVTLRQIGILKELAQRGNPVINPFIRKFIERMRIDETQRSAFLETCRKAMHCDVFVTGSNALTQDGKLVSIDYAGNRVAGMIYGASKIIVAVGRNKIVKNLDEAISRIKTVIAPAHAQWRKIHTPCALTGECSDCQSQSRICNITVILEKKPGHADFTVILVNEDLGLGWDPIWEEKRTTKIRSHYYKNTPVSKDPTS